MLLTLYYMAATWIQSYKLRSVSAKLTKFINDQMSVVFFNVQDDVNVPTSSDLCSNQLQARIADMLWHQDQKRGAAILPKQLLHIGHWISFPSPPTLVPFDYTENINLRLNENNTVHLLLETHLVPNRDNEILLIENFGQPIAWKVDSHLAILLKSDMHRLTELILTSFMQDCQSINDHLPLVRIESVLVEGEPQPFDSIKSHSRKDLISRSMRILSPEQWDRHITGLRSFGIFASQAFEFEYNKNRTEGKTGIVKPDLIPTKSVDFSTINTTTDTTNNSNETSPKRNAMLSPNSQDLSPTKTKVPVISQHTKTNSSDKNGDFSGLKKLSPTPKTSPRASPLKLIPEVDFMSEITTTPTTEPFVVESKKSPTKSDEFKIAKLKPDLEPIVTSITEQKEKKHEEIAVSSSSDKPKISTRENGTSRPTLVRTKGSLIACKPPNVLVYADSAVTRDSVISTLSQILERDMYTIYPLTSQQVQNKIWINNTTLLVICGYVSQDVGAILTEYFLNGGKMLSICSDVLHIVLPTFRTHAEVREHELVQFSYGRWHKVKMMHHIFCYQPSPVRKHFSTDSDDSQQNPMPKKPILVCPRSVDIIDLQDNKHCLQVQVLGTEETWNTPSLMLATNSASGGKAIFSQVHLEADPNIYEHDEAKYEILKHSDKARIEIFTDLLSSHLGIVVINMDDRDKPQRYTSAFFLGDHKIKYDLLEKLKPQMTEENLLKSANLAIKFCGKGVQPPMASLKLLPVLVNACPENFSTVDYFDNLKSEKVGRLAIYSPILTSSVHVLANLTLAHGLVVIARRQTNGIGRGTNQWLSPEGCVMVSIQLHIPLASRLGQRLSLIQHLIGTAMVNTIVTLKGYEELDIGIKWPNDIYANGCTKIGGLIVNSILQTNQAICNIGCALNLNNSTPTTCINDMINEYNIRHNAKLNLIGYEQFLALFFNEIERLYNVVQNDSNGMDIFYKLYQTLWLHSDAEVTILDSNGQSKVAKILGIDDYGYLQVQKGKHKLETVHPDGNSFDMLQGLITPK